MAKAELSYCRVSLPTSHPAERCSTTVPHSGPESFRGATTLLNGAETPGRTTAMPPWIGGPELLRALAYTCKDDQHAGFTTAPPGTTPCMANRHRAMSSFLAKATTITLRMRPPAPVTRPRNQATSAEPG